MKLLARYNRINLVAAIVVLLLSSVCYYFIIRFVLLHQLDQDLKVEEQEVLDFIRNNNKLPNATNYKGQRVSFAENNGKPIQRKFRSHGAYSLEEQKKIAVRELEFSVMVNATTYTVSISKSQAETEELIQLILFITLGLTALLLLILFIINRFMVNKLWRPFNTTLQELKQFNLSAANTPALEQTEIDEFKELNDAVSAMASRVNQDYGALKSFTENASHEIQTPLAIIKSKMELLVQSEHLQEEQVRMIETVQDAANRLSKLNQSLILLAKIENRQFPEIDKVDILQILYKHLHNYEELIAAKQIIVNVEMANLCSVLMNETLAEILVSNLVTNAIKHNVEKGRIELMVEDKQLTISNTGHPLKTDPAFLFERFQKDKISSESLGLGLSIVQKIALQYGFTVVYIYADGLHRLQVHF